MTEVPWCPRMRAAGRSPAAERAASPARGSASRIGEPTAQRSGDVLTRAGLLARGPEPGPLSTPHRSPYAHHVQNENTFYFADGKASA